MTLDRWLSYTGMIVCGLTGVDSRLVILDEWLSYTGGSLGKFDCIFKNI